jgi:uncharacterized damage-inducible protein DinB
MTPDESKFLLASYLPSITEEWEITKKVLRALRADRMDYRPDPKARSAADLAWHIVSSDVWLMEGITKGEFSMDEKEQPEETKDVEGLIAWYEAASSALLERIQSMDGEALAQPISFFGLFDHPAVVYLPFLQHHSLHHRGQLSTYLRPMGGKVPSIYGGSADEPFEMPG